LIFSRYGGLSLRESVREHVVATPSKVAIKSQHSPPGFATKKDRQIIFLALGPFIISLDLYRVMWLLSYLLPSRNIICVYYGKSDYRADNGPPVVYEVSSLEWFFE
uniref:Autophagy-related protein n=1 Tax=Ascaris lumbricoides TaxID=6252 RepID=A0A0M3HHC6_ASCLU